MRVVILSLKVKVMTPVFAFNRIYLAYLSLHEYFIYYIGDPFIFSYDFFIYLNPTLFFVTIISKTIYIYKNTKFVWLKTLAS